MSAAPGSTNKFILALDAGTTSSRSLLFDATGRVVARAPREITKHIPQPRGVEHEFTKLDADQAREVNDWLEGLGLAQRQADHEVRRDPKPADAAPSDDGGATRSYIEQREQAREAEGR